MQSLCRFVRRTGRLRLSARAFTNAGQGLRLKLPKYITLLKEEIHDVRFVSLQILPNYAVSVLQLRSYHGYAEDQYSDDEYGVESNQGSGGNARVELWKQKLTVLRNSRETEIVSVDKRDRRDYDAIASLAQRIGLYSQIYGKAVVFSKAPLPNYRPDMDDKRPIRKVSIPLSVHRVVDGLLQEHVDRKEILPGNPMASGNTNVSNETRYNASRHEEVTLSEDVLQRKSYHLHAKQRFWQESEKGKKMMELRMKLPAFKEKESILSAIAKNQVLVVSGETGCGKTTQLPQYILEAEIEAGHGASCSIICTQPRRISAISVAERVAAERGEELGESVGYKVRLEGMRGKNTRMLFCTTGILLRRLLVDPSLKGVSHVIVDEIHERGMNEDFLLIVLKDLLPRRPDLRLLLMSATLNAELFSSYFDGAPMCHIPGFTHPVTALFLEDVLEMTNYRLTEQNQLDNYGHDKNWKMQKQLQKRKRKDPFKDSVQEAYNRSEYQGYSDITQYSLSQWCSEGLGFNLIQAVLCHVCLKEREGAVLVFMTGWEDINALKDQLQCHPVLGDKSKVLVLPCHGAMATAEQKLIFDKPPGNVRKIVLATNMAETSITINDVVFVVDCGRAKETSYDALNNTPCLLPTWISKASARQRRGRAGRVQPGKCYHLYPRAVYDGLLEYQVPELLRTPLHSLCLQIKSLRLGSIMGFLSKALQPPELLSVQNAVDLLKTMGALDDNEELTYLGQHLSILPVEPRIGKMLIMGCIFRCLDPVLTIAAGLTLRDPFVLPSDKKLQAERARYKFGEHDASDHIALVRAYDGWVHAMKEGTAAEYCWGNFLSFQSLQAMQSLRNQFKSLLTEAGFLGQDAADYNQFSPDHEVLGGVICAGLFPGIAAVLSKTKAATFKTMEDGQVLLYQNSVLSKMQKIPYPWLAFNEKVKTGTVIIRDSTGVSDSMVLLFCGKVALGDRPGQLLMQDGKLEFYMLPDLAKTIYQLNGELNEMLCTKLKSPKIDVYKESRHLMEAILELLHGDRNEGSFGIGLSWIHGVNIDKNDAKCTLQNMVQKAGYPAPEYKHRVVNNNLFQAKVEIMNQRFIGRPASSKKQAEKNVAADAIEWLTRGPNSGKKSQIVAGRVSEKSEHNTKTKGEGKMIELVDKRRGERKAEDKVKATVETEKARVLRAQIRQVIKGYKRKPNELSMEGS